jgi:hypothetical protein
MNNKDFNDQVIVIFQKLKPIFEEYLELMKKMNKRNSFTSSTTEIIADCVKPFLEGEAAAYLSSESSK